MSRRRGTIVRFEQTVNAGSVSQVLVDAKAALEDACGARECFNVHYDVSDHLVVLDGTVLSWRCRVTAEFDLDAPGGVPVSNGDPRED